MSISLIPVIYGQVRAVASAVATAIANIASVKTDTATIATARAEATANRDNINTTSTNATNAARDNINTVAGNYYNSLVGHISNTAAAYDRAVKGVWPVINGGAVPSTAGNGGLGGSSYGDVAISAVNPAKTLVLPLKTVGGATSAYLVYRLISGTVVRWEQFGYSGGPGGYGFVVIEFY